MRKITANLFITILLASFMGCQTDKEHIPDNSPNYGSMIRKAYNYPSPRTYKITTTQAQAAKQFLDAGLEEKGYVEIDKVVGSHNMGEPLITFKAAADEFILSGEKDQNQVTLLTGYYELDSIYGHELNEDSDKLIITYTTKVVDETPFSVIVPKSRTARRRKMAYFEKANDQWIRTEPFILED